MCPPGLRRTPRPGGESGVSCCSPRTPVPNRPSAKSLVLSHPWPRTPRLGGAHGILCGSLCSRFPPPALQLLLAPPLPCPLFPHPSLLPSPLRPDTLQVLLTGALREERRTTASLILNPKLPSAQHSPFLEPESIEHPHGRAHVHFPSVRRFESGFQLPRLGEGSAPSTESSPGQASRGHPTF